VPEHLPEQLVGQEAEQFPEQLAGQDAENLAEQSTERVAAQLPEQRAAGQGRYSEMNCQTSCQQENPIHEEDEVEKPADRLLLQ
jgi:hypothetical protein